MQGSPSPPPFRLPSAIRWNNSSGLAQETIVKQLQAHERYHAKICEGTSDHVPRLVDLAATRLAVAYPETVQDAINSIPPVVAQSNIWRWHSIPYPILRRCLLRLFYKTAAEGSEWDQTSFGDMQSKVDEWIISNEKSLQVSDPVQWQRGLVTLDDAEAVFPNYVLTETRTARIITRPACLPGYDILCNAVAPQIGIQPSTAAFKRNFHRLSNGLLRDLDWNNLIVAGGIVLGTLLCGINYHPGDWKKSDIDIYLYGLSAAEAIRKVQHVFDIFRSNLPSGTRTLAVRNSKTITFYAKYPLRRLQIVLKVLRSPRDVLLNFDLDICAMGWDGSNVWMLPRAARALETGRNVFTMNLIHGHYLSDRRASQTQRVFKYASRGYGIRILPSYVSSLNRSAWEIPHEAPSLAPDMALLAERTRAWTEEWLSRAYNYQDPVSPRNLPGNFLGGFSALMRGVALWENLQDGDERVSNDWGPGDASYHDRPSRSLLREPDYLWNALFTFTGFRSHIEHVNMNEVGQWIRNDLDGRLQLHGVTHRYELVDSVRCIACASTLELLLHCEQDICLPVLLPCDFAVYANDLVSRAQASLGLKETKILEPAVAGFNSLGVPGKDKEGLFIWRISSDLMWQKLDRRIDEVFEVLYAFRRANTHLDEDLQVERLTRELSRRTVGRGGNEFDTFYQWVCKPPLVPLAF